MIDPASVAEKSRRVAALFDRVAGTYDAVGVPWFGPIAQRLVAELAPQPGERALDLGCGRGAATLPLAAAVGPSGSVTAVDLAPRMVSCLSAEVAERRLEHVDLLLGDAAAPDVGGRTFDVVTASLVLFFLPDPAAAVARWRELLVEGGRLGVTTFAEQAPEFRAVDDVFTPYLPQEVLDARTSGRAGPFASDEGVERLFVDAGLVDVRTVSYDVAVVLRDADHWHAWTWSHGQRMLWEHVPAEERDGVRREVAVRLEAARRDDGLISLGQRVRCTLGRRSG